MESYINKMGVKIEVISKNKKYITWRFDYTDKSYCVEKESFKNMIKANNYSKIKEMINNE